MLPFTGFLQLEDLIHNQGDVTLVVEYENKFPNYSTIIAFSEISSSPSPTDIPFVILKLAILTSVLIRECLKTAIANTLYSLHVRYPATMPRSQPLR